jgi:hypothetical protein
MSLSKILSRSSARAASTSSAAQLTKAAGDISSVFPSLRKDYKPEPLPPRFKDLKERVFRENEDALKKSWERLLPSLEEEVHKIKSKGSDVRILVLFVSRQMLILFSRLSLLLSMRMSFPAMCLQIFWPRSAIEDQ